MYILKMLLAFVLIYLSFHKALAVEEQDPKAEKQCTTKLDACILEMDPNYLDPKGESGKPFIGDPGLQGENGELGFGPVGPPGEPGVPGSCACGGLIGDPFPCKDPHPDPNTKIPLQLGPKNNKFTAYCGVRAREVCITQQKSEKWFDYTDKNEPFWLSEVNIDVLGTLHGLTQDQLEWLMQYSAYVRQTFRYHCNNSIPYNRYNVEKSVKLMTSNDKIVGPYPSESTPFFYSVPQNSDGCSASTDKQTEAKYSDIELQSESIDRLPIRDIQINDIRTGYQSFAIKHLELCFALFYYE